MSDYNFKFVGKIHPVGIVKKLNNLPSQVWEEYSFRQKTFDVHKHTQTIPVIFDEDFRLYNPTHTKWYPLFEEDLKKLKQKASKVYGDGYIVRCILVKLKAKKSIPTHVDGGESLNIARRIHVPIVTTHKVSFTVGDETKLMREGEMWEINNSRKKHSVQNTSSYDRIHLIFDYVPHSLLHQLNISTQ